MMEALYTSETSIYLSETAQCHIPEGCHLCPLNCLNKYVTNLVLNNTLRGYAVHHLHTDENKILAMLVMLAV
jgi:hypothetical protein